MLAYEGLQPLRLPKRQSRCTKSCLLTAERCSTRNLARPFLQSAFAWSCPPALHILQCLRGQIPVFYDSGHGISPMKNIGMNEWREPAQVLKGGEQLAGVGPGRWRFASSIIFQQRLQIPAVPASSTSDLDFLGNGNFIMQEIPVDPVREIPSRMY